MGEIAKKAKLATGTLYIYFKNKEELYTKLSQSCFEEVLGRIQSAVNRPGTTQERVLNFIKEYCLLCEERRSVARFLHLMSLMPDRTTPDVGVVNFNLQLGEFLKQILTDGVRNGEIKEELVNPLIYGLFAIFYLQISNLLAKNPIPHDFALVEKSVELILNQPQ